MKTYVVGEVKRHSISVPWHGGSAIGPLSPYESSLSQDPYFQDIQARRINPSENWMTA